MTLPTNKPYLIRAIYEWCMDNGFTPYLAVVVDQHAKVPREYVRDGQIVLNISADATSHLNLGNDYINFAARFGGVARDISIPIGNIVAVYARENGAGMAFDMEAPVEAETVAEVDGDLPAEPAGAADSPEPPTPPAAPAPGSGRPHLQRVK